MAASEAAHDERLDERARALVKPYRTWCGVSRRRSNRSRDVLQRAEERLVRAEALLHRSRAAIQRDNAEIQREVATSNEGELEGHKEPNDVTAASEVRLSLRATDR